MWLAVFENMLGVWVRLLFFFFITLLCGCGQSEQESTRIATPDNSVVELVSHRGIHAADNTIDGFYNAINLGFDSVETDLRMKGGIVVLAHDKAIKGKTYAALNDFLLFASNNNVKIWIEAKETEVIKPTLDMLSQYNLEVNFISYRQSDLDLIKSINPDVETGLIIAKAEQVESISAEWVVIEKSLIKGNHDKIKHLKVAAWTITNQSEYDDIKHLIDAVISDVELIK